MRLFSPEEYFDLTLFAHAALFDPTRPVWSALENIREYLSSSSLGVIEGEVAKGVYLIEPETIFVGRGTVIEAGAYIQGPCIIGEGCQIRNGAYIRGNLIVGNKCVIGHATEIKNSILLDGAQAAHFAYVGDSILGNHVNLGAGTKCANLRFDRRPVSVVWESRRIDSGLKKFGAILGDGVQTGCNSVTNPGTLMGKGSWLAPCRSIGGVVPQRFVRAK